MVYAASKAPMGNNIVSFEFYVSSSSLYLAPECKHVTLFNRKKVLFD